MNYNKSWNQVLNKFVEIKKDFISQYGESGLYNYNPSEEACLKYWVRMIGKKEYEDLIKPLQFTEYNGMLLIRYANFEKLFSKEDESLSDALDEHFSEKKFNFDTFWDLYDGFYTECRSVVIDIHKNELILTPFKKFRNLNECEENSLSNIRERIKNAHYVEISNKLDGSMQSARWYNEKVVMAGSQALNPENSWRLEDGYRMLKANSNYEKMLSENCHLTFIFEYISLKDAHVVRYKKEQEGLYLIGIRNTETGEEYSYAKVADFAANYNIPMTEIFDSSFEDIVSNLDKKRSDEAEGFVLNIDGYKVKIKYDDYVKMHKLLSVLSAPNLVIRSIADGNFDDFVSKVPEQYRKRVFEISNKVFAYINKTDEIIKSYFEQAPKHDKKTFMIWVDANVPKEYRGYVRTKYFGQNINCIKSHSGRYVRYSDIEDFLNKTNMNEKEEDNEYERE